MKQLNLVIPDAARQTLRQSDRPAQLRTPDPKPQPTPSQVAPKPS